MRRALGRNEKGFTLVETIIAIALLGIIGVTFLSALNVSLNVLVVTDERQTAMNLAESQMEHIKKQGYLASYSPAPIPDEYSGYSVAIYTEDISSRDDNIQKIRIVVSHQGKPVILTADSTLEGYKVKR